VTGHPQVIDSQFLVCRHHTHGPRTSAVGTFLSGISGTVFVAPPKRIPTTGPLLASHASPASSPVRIHRKALYEVSTTGAAVIVCAPAVVYICHQTYTLENVMKRAALTRTNLLLEVGKVRRLRKALRSRSNSEAVRRVIDERLAVETGLEALRSLRRLGAPDDVFGRAPATKR
jgi:cell division protein FtsL